MPRLLPRHFCFSECPQIKLFSLTHQLIDAKDLTQYGGSSAASPIVTVPRSLTISGVIPTYEPFTESLARSPLVIARTLRTIALVLLTIIGTRIQTLLVTAVKFLLLVVTVSITAVTTIAIGSFVAIPTIISIVPSILPVALIIAPHEPVAESLIRSVAVIT